MKFKREYMSVIRNGNLNKLNTLRAHLDTAELVKMTKLSEFSIRAKNKDTFGHFVVLLFRHKHFKNEEVSVEVPTALYYKLSFSVK